MSEIEKLAQEVRRCERALFALLKSAPPLWDTDKIVAAAEQLKLARQAVRNAVES